MLTEFNSRSESLGSRLVIVENRLSLSFLAGIHETADYEWIKLRCWDGDGLFPRAGVLFEPGLNVFDVCYESGVAHAVEIGHHDLA